jgi:hypothetical protein
MYLIPMLRLVDIPALVVCCEENPEIVGLSRLWTAASWAALPLIAASSLTIRLPVDYFSAVNSAKAVMTRTD